MFSVETGEKNIAMSCCVRVEAVITRGGGGGATHYLGVGTNCETTSPTFWQWTAPGFRISKFTAPSVDRSSLTDPSNHQLSINFFCFILPKYTCEVFMNNQNEYNCYLMDNINN